jgi:uncharacterized protein DUF6152
MRRRTAIVLAAAALLGPAASALFGHHSVESAFDATKRIKVTGVISKVDWLNPHIYVYVDAKDASGAVTTWMLETIPPAAMRRAGVTKELLMGHGETVVVDAYPARDGTKNFAFILRTTYPDGHHYQLYTEGDSNGTGR